MANERKIKTFSDFMSGSKMRRFMSHLVIEGQTKTWLLGKSKAFELHVYYTPVKEIMVEIKIYSDSLKIEDLNLNFKKGDNIQKARDWAESNNYQIVADISRMNY